MSIGPIASSRHLKEIDALGVGQVDPAFAVGIDIALADAIAEGSSLQWPFYPQSYFTWDMRTGLAIERYTHPGQWMCRDIIKRCRLLNRCYWQCVSSQNEHVVEGQI